MVHVSLHIHKFFKKLEYLLIDKLRIILKRTMASLGYDSKIALWVMFSPGRHSRFDVAKGIMIAQ